MDQTHYFGAGGVTHFHPAVIVFLILASILILVVRRQYVIYPFLFAAVLVPLSQVVIVGGVHFMALRILVLVGWLRVIVGSAFPGKQAAVAPLTSIDKAFLLWMISSTVMFTVLWGQWGSFINAMGIAYTDLGLLFLFRFLIRDNDDVERSIKALGYVCIVCGVLMLGEQIVHLNVFGYFGDVPSLNVEFREGKYRSQASFLHPLLAGAFGATIIPLFIGLWVKNKKARVAASIGLMGCLLMAVTSMSSTSLMAMFAGFCALCLWPLRRRMRLVRWTVASVLIALHLVMKAPVWALIARIDLMGGSSGYHRFELVNQTIIRFKEWWLVGTTNQANWGWDMWDSIDWYVAQCTSGGLLTLILFVAIIVYGFKRIGKSRKEAEIVNDRNTEFFMWTLGATLFSNAITFIGVSYFDQSIVVWLAFLAIVSAATQISQAGAVTESAVETAELHRPYRAPHRRPRKAGVLIHS
jgi:hypothetical protein